VKRRTRLPALSTIVNRSPSSLSESAYGPASTTPARQSGPERPWRSSPRASARLGEHRAGEGELDPLAKPHSARSRASPETLSSSMNSEIIGAGRGSIASRPAWGRVGGSLVRDRQLVEAGLDHPRRGRAGDPGAHLFSQRSAPPVQRMSNPSRWPAKAPRRRRAPRF